MAVALSFAFSAVSFAADKAAEAPKADAAPVKAKAKVKQVTGVLVSVDTAARTVTVKGRNAEVVISADEKMLADLKAGEKVMVKYTEQDGKNVAKKITKAAAKTEKKEAAKK
jgi:Cu/Ag efflux protein CusF